MNRYEYIYGTSQGIRDNLIISIIVAIGVIISVGVLIVGVNWIVNYEKELYVTVQDRYWSSYTAVKYDEYECSYRTNFNGDWVNECGWETYTRCRDIAFGRELPTIYPPIPCEPHGGDYLRQGVTYTFSYREEDETDVKSATFHESYWDSLEPGRHRTIVLNMFGNLMRLEEK